MNAAFTIHLSCSHEVEWQESPELGGGGPYKSMLMYCPACNEDQEIEYCEPPQYIVHSETLSEAEPKQTDAGASGMAWTAGTRMVVYWDAEEGGFWYYLTGVGETGLAYETDNAGPFASLREAKEAAHRQYYANLDRDSGLAPRAH